MSHLRTLPGGLAEHMHEVEFSKAEVVYDIFALWHELPCGVRSGRPVAEESETKFLS